MKIKTFSPLCVIFLIVVDRSAAEDDKIQVRFVAERVPRDLKKVVLHHGEYKSETFGLPMNNLSSPIDVPVRSFSLFDPDKKQSIAKIKLPEEGSSFVVLFVVSGPEGYAAVVMPYHNPNFIGGDFYLYNNSNKLVFGVVGESRFAVKPGDGMILRPSGAREERYFDVGLGYGEEGVNKVISTTRWRDDKKIRSYVFFYENPKTGWVAFRAVDEFVRTQQP